MTVWEGGLAIRCIPDPVRGGNLALLVGLLDFERRWVGPSTNRFALLGLGFIVGNFLLLSDLALILIR
jgi:hypothetical protein